MREGPRTATRSRARRRRRFGAAVALLALLLHAPAPAQAEAPRTPTARVERFSGQVRRGAAFERRVFGGLRFRLVPEPGTPGEGWTIGLFAADTLADFVAIATPPFHGVNPRMIDAWHFRDADNTGPNHGSVNAPQDEREFRFVADPSGHAAAAAALDLALWPGARTQAAVDSALAVLDSVSRGAGLLRLHRLRLGGLGRGHTPFFESFSFDVTLSLPAPETRP